MSKITNYYRPSYSIIKSIAMKFNIITTHTKINNSRLLRQKLITDYYKPTHCNIYNIPGQNKITKYFTIIN